MNHKTLLFEQPESQAKSDLRLNVSKRTKTLVLISDFTELNHAVVVYSWVAKYGK